MQKVAASQDVEVVVEADDGADNPEDGHQRLDGAVVFSGATNALAPEGAELIGITLSGVRIEGALPQMAAAICVTT